MFKACLFLGAGCIIHAVHSNEMSAMGGLASICPSLISHSLSHVLPSQVSRSSQASAQGNEIITACFEYLRLRLVNDRCCSNDSILYVPSLLRHLLEYENKELHAHHTPHEAPLTWHFPLIFLSIVTVGVGVFTTLGGFCDWSWASFGSIVSAAGTAYTVHFDPQVAATSTVIAILSIALATYIYKGEKQPIADKMYATFPRLHRWAYKRFYMDEVYQYVTHKILFRYVSRTAQWIEREIINGLIDFSAWGANEAGRNHPSMAERRRSPGCSMVPHRYGSFNIVITLLIIKI